MKPSSGLSGVMVWGQHPEALAEGMDQLRDVLPDGIDAPIHCYIREYNKV